MNEVTYMLARLLIFLRIISIRRSDDDFKDIITLFPRKDQR